MNEIKFAVIGIPAPQGSKRHVGHGVLIESSAKVKPWRQAVEWAASEAVRSQSWQQPTGPVEVTVMFSLPRPKSAPKRRTRPTTRPDLDKLIRSTLDALTTSGLYRDDAQVVRIAASKWYTPPGKPSGAIVTVVPVVAALEAVS